jgi:surface protein
MSEMFYFANSFKKDISSWNIINVTSMEDMFDMIVIETAIYDNMLTKWSQLNVKQNVIFNAGVSNFCDAFTAKQTLSNNFNWHITDNGRSCE